ncbi:MAG: hypothetical protein HKP57_12030 [Halobacteria archaeon]|nr:hypothetical protein [Halobacteria archaeon]
MRCARRESSPQIMGRKTHPRHDACKPYLLIISTACINKIRDLHKVVNGVSIVKAGY